jgi:hypothetical protein
MLTNVTHEKEINNSKNDPSDPHPFHTCYTQRLFPFKAQSATFEMPILLQSSLLIHLPSLLFLVSYPAQRHYEKH